MDTVQGIKIHAKSAENPFMQRVGLLHVFVLCPPFPSFSLKRGSYQSTSEALFLTSSSGFLNSSDLMCIKPMTSRKQVLDPTHTILPYVADRSAAISCWSLKSNELCKWMWIADCLEFSLQFLSIL